MSPIRKLGNLMATDAEGYLLNECAWESIQNPWLALVCDLRDSCVEELGDRLHSLYLRGSVPRGTAIVGVSDLDSVAIVRGNVTPDDEAALLPLLQNLKQRHSFCPKIELPLLSLEQVQQPESPWQSLIQLQSLCIYGENLQPTFPRFKPGVELVRHAFDLAKELAEVQTVLRQISASDPHFDAQVKGWCGWIARRLVRVGFELVMAEERAFTRDLYPCYDYFSRHYPAQERQMRKALELAIQPSSDRNGLLLFLSDFGSWLVEQVDRTLVITAVSG